MSFTVHLVDLEWYLQAFCLDTVPLFDDHTGQNIREAFQDILTNWNLSMDQVVAAFSCIYSEWLSYFGQNLNLVISKALQIDSVQRCIKKC